MKAHGSCADLLRVRVLLSLVFLSIVSLDCQKPLKDSLVGKWKDDQSGDILVFDQFDSFQWTADHEANGKYIIGANNSVQLQYTKLSTSYAKSGMDRRYTVTRVLKVYSIDRDRMVISFEEAKEQYTYIRQLN